MNRSSSATGLRMYFFDSGAADDYNTRVSGYDYVWANQVDWLMRNDESLTKATGFAPALAFMHIPTEEWGVAWNNAAANNKTSGVKQEGIGASTVNGGIIAGMLQVVLSSILAFISSCIHFHKYSFIKINLVCLCQGSILRP